MQLTLNYPYPRHWAEQQSRLRNCGSAESTTRLGFTVAFRFTISKVIVKYSLLTDSVKTIDLRNLKARRIMWIKLQPARLYIYSQYLELNLLIFI